jgi:hypothetical protein
VLLRIGEEIQEVLRRGDDELNAYDRFSKPQSRLLHGIVQQSGQGLHE